MSWPLPESFTSPTSRHPCSLALSSLSYHVILSIFHFHLLLNHLFTHSLTHLLSQLPTSLSLSPTSLSISLCVSLGLWHSRISSLLLYILYASTRLWIAQLCLDAILLARGVECRTVFKRALPPTFCEFVHVFAFPHTICRLCIPVRCSMCRTMMLEHMTWKQATCQWKAGQ